MTVTKEQVKAAISVLQVVAETIRELKQVPNGHLYAQVAGQMSLVQYEKVISTLKRTGLVSEYDHLLVWNEPKPAPINSSN